MSRQMIDAGGLSIGHGRCGREVLVGFCRGRKGVARVLGMFDDGGVGFKRWSCEEDSGQSRSVLGRDGLNCGRSWSLLPPRVLL
jgi:hypothetical protein